MIAAAHTAPPVIVPARAAMIASPRMPLPEGSSTAGPDAPETDHQLIIAVAGGDRQALGRLYDRYAPVLRAVGVRVMGNPRDAEDLVHDVFLETWRHAHDYDPARGSLRAWLILRMRSRAIDRCRSPAHSRTVPMDNPLAHEVAAPEVEPGGGDDHRRVRRAVERLAPELREVLGLSYFHGLSGSEIAARTGWPLGTVKSRMAKALSLLRTELAHEGGA